MDRPPFTAEQLAWLKDNLPRGPFQRTLGDAVPVEQPSTPVADPPVEAPAS